MAHAWSAQPLDLGHACSVTFHSVPSHFRHMSDAL